MTTATLKEFDAAVAYARAWNRLDPSDFIELLASDACYATQWVFEELKCRDDIADYLKRKMQTVKNHCQNNPQQKVFAELAQTSEGNLGRHCVFLAAGKKENVMAVVLFKVEGSYIQRFDLDIPELQGAVRNGIYPI